MHNISHTYMEQRPINKQHHSYYKCLSNNTWKSDTSFVCTASSGKLFHKVMTSGKNEKRNKSERVCIGCTIRGCVVRRGRFSSSCFIYASLFTFTFPCNIWKNNFNRHFCLLTSSSFLSKTNLKYGNCSVRWKVPVEIFFLRYTMSLKIGMCRRTPYQKTIIQGRKKKAHCKQEALF